MRDPRERVRDMLEAIAAIERYLHRGKDELERDELLQCWFVHNLQIIGEAAKALPEEVRALAPEVEWHKIIGMRNVLVHGYFAIRHRDRLEDGLSRRAKVKASIGEAFGKIGGAKAMNCGEAYVDEATARDLLWRAEGAARTGMVLDIREYVG